MNVDDYCQQKAAPPGSSVYYALRQAPFPRQPLLTAWFALRRELEETVRETSDPTVGRTKLAWWQKELAAMVAGQPTHPVTQALAAHHAGIAQEHNALQALVAGFEMDLDQARYLDFANLRRYIGRVGGDFTALVVRAACEAPEISASAAARTTPATQAVQATPATSAANAAAATNTSAPVDPPAWAYALGEAWMLAQFVQELGNDARHGRVYIPIDELQRYGVTASDLINRRYSPEFTELMRFETQRARAALDVALAAIPAGERRVHRALIALATLARAVLDEIERDDFQVLHQRIALTPIRKFWIAWRAARKR